MSELNSSTLSSTKFDETVSPETISLSYEELFDNNASEVPCYLPDKAEVFCQTSNHEDTTVEEDEVNIGTSDNQHEDEVSVLIENNLPENADTLDENCAPEISSIDSSAKTSQKSEPQEDSRNQSSSESDYDGSDLEEREQVLEPHQLAPNRNHNVTDNSGQTEKRDENGLFTSESSEISFEPEDYDSEPIGEGKHISKGRDENGFTSGYQESSEIVSESESYKGELSNTEIILDEDNESGIKVHRGKQHGNEDDGSLSWRKHKKHFFILSNAGKPIYSRYGDEHKLAGFSATLQAIISFVENSGDRVRYVRAGDHQVVFLVKGPIYLVSISSTDEPYYSLKEQLELLYGQLLLILTKSLEKCFLKNANFDLRPLLGGTETVFSSLMRSFSWNPASFLHSYTCLPLSNTARQAAGAALHDVADSDLLFALLLTGAKVISLVGSQKASLHPDDILLLSNFVSSSESFRTTESFSPICLPHYNPMAFLYAYVSYLDSDTCLILITKNSNSFFHLKESRSKVENFLIETDVLREIGNSVAKGGLRVEDLPGDVLYGSLARARRKGNDADGRSSESSDSLRAGVGGAAGLWHFMYRSVYLEQYVASEFSPPLHKRDSQKRLFRAYERLYASIHGAPAGPHQMQYRRDENHVLLAWSTPDFEFFAAFDPLAEKSSAITVCNRVCQWIRDVENEIFYVGASPFNW